MARQRSRLHQTLRELRRRHVIRVTGAYAVCSWFTLQVGDVILPALMVPDWIFRVLVVLAIAGLPIVAILTWIYDITPEGVVRTNAETPQAAAASAGWNWRWLDFVIIACLLGILTFMLLRSSTGELQPEPRRSIAVLPFADLSPERDTGYFSDGMSEAIMDTLARIPELQVAARTSSFSFRDSEFDVRRVAEELAVDTVLEGSVRKAGERLLVSARLIDGASGHSLWNETYEGSLGDVFAVQDSISRAIVDVLQIRLLGDQTLVDVPTRSQAAYDYYLRGRASLRREATLANLEQAIEMFERALERDTRFGLAKAGLCTAYWQKYESTLDSRMAERAIATCEQAQLEDRNRAEIQIALGNIYRGTGKSDLALPAFRQALQLEPDNSEAHVGLGRVLQATGDFDAAESHLRRAIELDPAFWRNYSYLGSLYFDRGQFAEAAEQFARAIRLEPASPRSYSNLGGALQMIGDFDAAAEAYRESIARQPTATAYSNAGTSYFYLRNYPEAEAMYREAVALSPSDYRWYGHLADAIRMHPDRELEATAHYRQAIALAEDRLDINPNDYGAYASLALYQARVGKMDAAREALLRLAAAEPLSNETHRTIAEIHLELGDRSTALDYFARVIEGGWPTALLSSQPQLEQLRDDPRFLALLDNDHHPN